MRGFVFIFLSFRFTFYGWSIIGPMWIKCNICCVNWSIEFICLSFVSIKCHGIFIFRLFCLAYGFVCNWIFLFSFMSIYAFICWFVIVQPLFILQILRIRVVSLMLWFHIDCLIFCCWGSVWSVYCDTVIRFYHSLFRIVKIWALFGPFIVFCWPFRLIFLDLCCLWGTYASCPRI